MNANADLRARAHAGDTWSKLRLAHMILTGHEPGLAPDEALRLVKDACAQRLPDALLYHATLAARGFGRPQNFDEAVKLVAEAAACGSTHAKGQLITLNGKIDQAMWFAPAELVQHHTAPRVFTIKNFLPKPVCKWFIKFARNRLERAPVQGAHGVSLEDARRSNSAAGVAMLQADLVVQLTHLRIAAITGVAIEQQEATNILHYARNQQYVAHFDFVHAKDEAGFAEELRTLGQRVLTFLVYLNEEYEGGETEFPKLDWRFKGETGDALMFWNLSEAGEREPLSLHAGLPVLKGEKWLLSKWMRQRPVPLPGF